MMVRPLNDAAVAGHVEVMRLLLKAGANPNLAGEDGLGPLHSAAIGGRAEAARVLLDAGADPCRRASLDGISGLASALTDVRSDLPRQRRADTLGVLRPAEARC